MGFGGATMKVWESGEMVVRPHSSFDRTIAGQWYTVNNIALILVPSDGGDRITIPYIFMSPDMVVVNNDRTNVFMAPTGRYNKLPEEQLGRGAIARPVVPDLVTTGEIQAGVRLAAANHQLWDMDNIPAEAAGRTRGCLTVRIKGGGWALVPEASTPTARILILTGNSASQSILRASGTTFWPGENGLRSTICSCA